jgi:hypothetical protein
VPKRTNPIENLTDRQLVLKTNSLARRFYSMMGCQVPDGYKFYKAAHPQEVLCWDMAAASCEFWTATEIEDALSAILEDEEADDEETK